MTAPRAPLVLASRSPQRRAILEQLGVAFEVVVPDVEELTVGDLPGLVVENARRKVAAVEGECVLGADTAVALDERLYGKPRDAQEAEATLRRLAGRTHEVWSGIVVRERGEERCGHAVTRVRMRPAAGGWIEWYLASGEWRERAGGYAIQGRGAALVEEVQGDFWNVVGLPVNELLRLIPNLLVRAS